MGKDIDKIKENMKEEHLLFSNEYLKDFNGTRAYKAAYGQQLGDETAAVNASKLLRHTNVNAYIKERMRDRIKRTEIDQDEVVYELANIMRANVTEVVNVKDGKIIIRDTEELPESVTSVIKAIKPVKGGVEVEFHDKIKAIELLGRHLGMFDDRLAIESTQEEKVADILEGLVDAANQQTS